MTTSYLVRVLAVTSIVTVALAVAGPQGADARSGPYNHARAGARGGQALWSQGAGRTGQRRHDWLAGRAGPTAAEDAGRFTPGRRAQGSGAAPSVDRDGGSAVQRAALQGTTASTAAPVSAQPSLAAASGTVRDAIYQASVRWNVNYAYLIRLATCESSLNPSASNPSGASGLFQFMPSTYAANAARIGETGSLWNAYSSANVAASMISRGQASQWACAR